ncbi:MAG: cob(I)yrinic acid a,c-diamide adenosyltransferase [Nitrospiraceae bacterium]
MRITRVYTKTGDEGKTRLAGGQQVWKDTVRVDAYGTVDELNAALGMARAYWRRDAKKAQRAAVERDIHWMQNKLFDIGGLLSTVPGQSFPNMPSIQSADVTRLEDLMDEWQKDLQPLKEFILPGGGMTSSMLHFARTICRRAERRCVTLMRKEPVDQAIIIYLNRLSDALFVLARWVSHRLGEEEVLWERTNRV